jgi:hypothetical protein
VPLPDQRWKGITVPSTNVLWRVFFFFQQCGTPPYLWYSTLLIHWQEKFSQLLFSWKIDSVVISRLNTLRPLILGYCIQQCTLNTKWTQIAPTMNSRGTTTFFLYQHCADASCGHFKHLIYWRKQHNNWLMSVDYTFCIC